MWTPQPPPVRDRSTTFQLAEGYAEHIRQDQNNIGMNIERGIDEVVMASLRASLSSLGKVFKAGLVDEGMPQSWQRHVARFNDTLWINFKEYVEEDCALLAKGCCNLQKHIENARKFGVNVVVAVNKFKTDTAAEIEVVRKAAIDAGAYDAVMSNHWAEGGAGAADLARAVEKACKANDEANFKFLYPLDLSIKEKIGVISKEIYGADGVDYAELAEKQIAQYEEAGLGGLPICIAKTQYSFSCDAAAKGVPTGFRIAVREIRGCAGAGFLYPICGDMMTIPGLPTRPGFYDVDVDLETGDVVGLF